MTPTIIFIIPYRDRVQHQHFFKQYMKHVLDDYDEDTYEIYFSHQTDVRPFNRGATKNIGFLVMKEKYPDDYTNITFVFNDVDTVPYKKGLFNYATTRGVVKHFYGYTNSLGGIVSITGHDFERINGYPNLWGWGWEDNILQSRVKNTEGLIINRDQHYKITDQNVLQLFESFYRNIGAYNKRMDTVLSQKGNSVASISGINSINTLKWNIDGDMINITSFNTEQPHQNAPIKIHNMLDSANNSVLSRRGNKFGNMWNRQSWSKGRR
jgi:hypothetical protein